MAKAATANKKRSRGPTAAAAVSKKQKPTAARKQAPPANANARAKAKANDEKEVAALSTSEDDSDDDSTEQTVTEEDDAVVVAESDVDTNDETGTASDDNGDSGDDESDAPVPVPVKKATKSAAPARGKATPAAKKMTRAKSAAKPTAKPATKSTAKPAAVNSKSRSKAAVAAKKAPVKKRRGRSQEDKILENAPMSKPFYAETGSDWHGQDIDFDELSALRGMWELPSACHILWLLQNPLTLRFSHKLLDFEAALLEPASSRLLEDVFTKLLLKKSERDCLSAGIGLKYEWWSKQLREYYMALYDKWYALLRKAGEAVPASFSDDSDSDSDADALVDVELSDDEWLALDILKARLEALGKECPLKHKSYAELPAPLRCKILHNLCEAVIDDPSNTEHVRMMEEDDMRVEPLGRDRAGNLFYFFPQFYEERRLYRLDVATRDWGLWAKGDAGFRELLTAMRALRGRKVPGEQELLDHLEVIVEQLDDEAAERARELERATKRAVLDAIPRKRSVRIQVKQIEQMEAQRLEVETKQQLSLEELADLKRAELLRKVEMDAAREERERERETEKLAQEQREREAAAAERELRRLRRLEKEREDDAEQRRLELERQKEREARELRAKQRKAAEEAARAQEEIDAAEDAVVVVSTGSE